MILVEIGPNAGVWLTHAENNFYRKVKFNDMLRADNLSSKQLEIARQLINKSVLSRKKHNGELYYTISGHVDI